MWGKNTIFENKTGLEVLDEVAENLSANVIGWQTTCGFFDGYGDSGPGGGPLRKVILDNPPEDPGIEDWGGLNAPEDITSNGDGTWNERVFLNKARDFSVKKWTGIVLHELLHGSDQIDTAADILADKFFFSVLMEAGMVLSGRAAREYSGAHFRLQRKPERQPQ